KERVVWIGLNSRFQQGLSFKDPPLFEQSDGLHVRSIRLKGCGVRSWKSLVCRLTFQSRIARLIYDGLGPGASRQIVILQRLIRIALQLRDVTEIVERKGIVRIEKVSSNK